MVRNLLWGGPDSHVEPGYIVSKDFVDCTQKLLPAPLKEGSKVVVLCGTPLSSYTCLPPAEATTANVNRLQQWIDDLRGRERDPVLLQIHERLFKDAELIRESSVTGTFMWDGERVRPMVFNGTVSSMEPVPMVSIVTAGRGMSADVSRVLFGDREAHIRVACRSNKCAGATVGAKVVGYCYISQRASQDCLTSVISPEMSIPWLKQWLVEAGLESQEDSDFEEIHAAVSGTSGHRHSGPVLFVGEIIQLGSVPHVFVCKQAVSQSVEFSVSQVLIGKQQGKEVKTSYINCSNQPLPAPPFSLHAKVIVYCYGTHDRCLIPVALTQERLGELQSWKLQ